jgi:Cys-tRNA(Pro)/Cys-tRNA(Cys) deacylase
MRILDKSKAEYKAHSYIDTDAISGIEVAEVLNKDPNQVFKTLVTVGKSNKYYVTTIDNSANNYETIIFSAGKIGYQVEISLIELKKCIDFRLADIKD